MTTNISTTPIVGQNAYNEFEGFKFIPYNCITYLVNNNESIWKLLKYTDPDAWKKADLSREEKAELIYNGQGDVSNYKVFMDEKQPDVWTKEVSFLRILTYYAVGLNRTVGAIEVCMEIYCHYNINHLSNYSTRIDYVTEELLRVFNGTMVGGLGNLVFDKMSDESSRLFLAGQLPFGGKKLIFTTLVA